MAALDVACPKCKAEAGQRCRSLMTRRTTDVHMARWAAAAAPAAHRAQPTTTTGE